MAATPEHISSAPRFLTPARNPLEIGKPVACKRDLFLTCYEILLEFVRPRKVWQVAYALGMQPMLVKRHTAVLLNANLLTVISTEESTNSKGKNQVKKDESTRCATSYMCTPLANHFFEALGDYYKKYRERKVAGTIKQTMPVTSATRNHS